MSSDVTERRYKSDIPSELSPPRVDEATLTRNLVILTEKQGLFEQKAAELRQLRQQLETSLTHNKAEVALISHKVAEESLRKEELSALIHIQRIRKEAALREFALKNQQVALVQTCAPHTLQKPAKHRAKSISADLKSRKTALVKAGEDLIALQREVLTKATEIKRKQGTLQASRSGYNEAKEALKRVTEELAACGKGCQATEDDNKAKSEAILALVKSAAHTRSLIASAESQKRRFAELQSKKAQLKQKKASIISRHTQLSEEESRLKALEASEGAVESRVLGVLAKDSQWKSLHYHDLRQILGSIQRIVDKEAMLKRTGTSRFSV